MTQDGIRKRKKRKGKKGSVQGTFGFSGSVFGL